MLNSNNVYLKISNFNNYAWIFKKKSEIILTMYNIRKTKSRDASMKSSSNSSMNVGSKKPKDYKINVNEYLIMEHDSEYQCSQLNLKKDKKKENCSYLMNHLLN